MDRWGNLRIFTGSANPALAEKIAREIQIPLGRLRTERFADGEVRVMIEESTRGMDVFLVQPTCAPVNESIMELLIMIDAFRRSSARRITLVMPYYGYSRQDKKIKPREPVSARLVADLITTAGASRILAIDLHAGQIQGFFQIPLDHLYAGPLLADYFRKANRIDGNTVVVSPDVGGVARARAMAESLGAGLAIIAKRRSEPNKSEVMEIIGALFQALAPSSIAGRPMSLRRPHTDCFLAQRFSEFRTRLLRRSSLPTRCHFQRPKLK
jgi:ribose-phosphate pyrophosphokinase